MDTDLTFILYALELLIVSFTVRRQMQKLGYMGIDGSIFTSVTKEVLPFAAAATATIVTAWILSHLASNGFHPYFSLLGIYFALLSAFCMLYLKRQHKKMNSLEL